MKRAKRSVMFVGLLLGFATSALAGAKADYETLKGKWVRSDGGYVIEIKSIEKNGKMDAAYFNPNPIHVEKAKASKEGTSTKVFIELQDVNYPGSTYTLKYVPSSDQLQGIYFQAVEKQNFDVAFERLK